MILLDIILPFLFYEYSFIVIGFVAIVIIETLIFSLITRLRFKDTIKTITIANFYSTICGYIVIGLSRLILFGLFFWFFGAILKLDKFSDFLETNPIISGLSGNIGLDFNKHHSSLSLTIIIEFLFSFILGLIVSIYIETKYVKNKIINERIKKAMIWANIASYILIFGLMIWNYIK